MSNYNVKDILEIHEIDKLISEAEKLTELIKSKYIKSEKLLYINRLQELVDKYDKHKIAARKSMLVPLPTSWINK